MPWEEKVIVTMREEFVKRVLSHEKSKAELCREYGISRPTGDKWIERYLNGQPLCDQSRAPHIVGNKTNDEVEKFIVEYRKKYPAIGATKIHRMLRDEGITDIPCPRTINDIFKRNGLITKEASQIATPYVRFEKSEPNEMWQADFKGHFAMRNGARCHPLDIIDDCSRFSLCCAPLAGETYIEVRQQMEHIFLKYGMPFSFLCDNGTPWGTSQSTGFSRFEVWFMELGILTLHGRIFHPQTQGKLERFHRSLKAEVLQGKWFADSGELQRAFEHWRTVYNLERPHEALGMNVPASRYQPSARQYNGNTIPPEYDEGVMVRKVDISGKLSVKGVSLSAGKAFRGERVGLRETQEDGCYDVWWYSTKVGVIDLKKKSITIGKGC